MLSLPLLRMLSYEVFLYMHQALAVLVTYSIWRHLALQPLLPCVYIYVFAGIFLLTFLLQYRFIIWRNKAVSCSFPQASISYMNDTVKICLTLSRLLKVKAGQHIRL
jgi:hypothetical protein